MRKTALILALGGFVGLTTAPAPTAHAAPIVVPQVSEPAIQPVWYDRWGRWHPPYAYGYGYGPPRYYGYGYGPPRPYGYWRWRRAQCFRWGNC